MYLWFLDFYLVKSNRCGYLSYSENSLKWTHHKTDTLCKKHYDFAPIFQLPGQTLLKVIFTN